MRLEPRVRGSGGHALFASSQMAFEGPECPNIQIWEHSRGARMRTVLNLSLNLIVNTEQPLDLA